MNPPDQKAPEKVHRFLDEAGDTTFFGKGRVPMLGQDGVSLSFCAGADFAGGGPLRRGEIRGKRELLHAQASVDRRK